MPEQWHHLQQHLLAWDYTDRLHCISVNWKNNIDCYFKCWFNHIENAKRDTKLYRRTPRPVAKHQPFMPCMPSVYPGLGSFHAMLTAIYIYRMSEWFALFIWIKNIAQVYTNWWSCYSHWEFVFTVVNQLFYQPFCEWIRVWMVPDYPVKSIE